MRSIYFLFLFHLCVTTTVFGQSFPTGDRFKAFSGLVYNDATATHLPAGVLTNSSMDARPADLDGDGDRDLVIACEFCPNIILINDGSGIFSDESALRIPQPVHDSEDIGIADLDLDGDPDIVFVSEDDSLNELYLNTGSGFFVDAGERLPVRGISNAVLVTDIDGDGIPDIVIGNQGQNRILINDGTAMFTDQTVLRIPPGGETTQDLEWGDIDMDGDGDLIEGNEDGNRILINDGQGFFSDETAVRLPAVAGGEETREADLGDVNGDGYPDLFLANVTFQQGKPARNRLLLNDGQGYFTDVSAAALPVLTENTVDGDLVDLDADGDRDIIVAQAFNGTFRILVNDGSGVFSDATASFLFPVPAGNGVDVEWFDADGDSLNDLYLCGFQQDDYLYLAEQLPSGNESPAALPGKRLILFPNYPNPFNPETRIRFYLPVGGRTRIEVFDGSGRMVSLLGDEPLEPGEHHLTWSGRNSRGGLLASGIYVCRITHFSPGKMDRRHRKLMLIR